MDPPRDDPPRHGHHTEGFSPYAALDPGSNEIRLVEILPGHLPDPIELNIRKTNLRDCPQYLALSYVWNPQYGMRGDSVDPVKIRNCKGCHISIGENLDAAIRSLRARTIEQMPVWIDALCINQ